MSLLNDALKRAKLEALEREAAGQSNYGMPTLPGDTSRRRHSVPAILGAIVLLAALGVAIGWLLGRVTASTDTELASASSPATVEASKATTDGEDSAVEMDEGSGAANIPVTPAGTARGEDSQVALAEADEVPVADSEVGEVEAAIGPSSPEAEAPSAPAAGDSAAEEPRPAASSSLSPTDGATYVRVLEQRGQRLELQGIAFRGGTSVAIINDLMVSRDDMVGGFLVVAIEPERVQLQSGGVTFYLSLH